MANRVNKWLQELIEMKVEWETSTNHRQKANLSIRRDKLKRALTFFGTRYHLIKVEIHYYPYLGTHNEVKTFGNLTKEILYLTDCTQEEAYSYIHQFRYRHHKIDKCQISRISLGNPEKI